MMHLQDGQLVTAPFLSAVAEVKKFEPRTGYYLLEVVLHDGHHTYQPLRITGEQLAQIEVLQESPVALTGNAEDFFFLIEAHRIRLAYQFDPQLAVSVSQVDPEPHHTGEALQECRADMQGGIRLERNLMAGEPRFLGVAVLLPPVAVEPEPEAEAGTITYQPRPPELAPASEGRVEYDAAPGMRRDEEIEAVGMQVAMQYERDQGWHPEDVSGENHGFDVRSTRYDSDGTFAGIRYVEVKARARSGAIRLSANEWKKARHFDDKFWLYVVTEAATDAPQLNPIQHPAAHFQMDEDIFATGFIIPEENWQERIGSTS
jgi:hypothetical protein